MNIDILRYLVVFTSVYFHLVFVSSAVEIVFVGGGEYELAKKSEDVADGSYGKLRFKNPAKDISIIEM